MLNKKRKLFGKDFSLKILWIFLLLTILFLVSVFQTFQYLEYQRVYTEVKSLYEKGVFGLAEIKIDQYLEKNKGSEELSLLKLQILQNKKNPTLNDYANIIRLARIFYNSGALEKNFFYTILMDTFYQMGPDYSRQALHYLPLLEESTLPTKQSEKNLLVLKALLSSKDDEKLFSSLNALYEIDKKNIYVILHLARAYTKKGKLLVARDILEDGVSIFSENYVSSKGIIGNTGVNKVNKNLFLLNITLSEIFARLGLDARSEYHLNFMPNNEYTELTINEIRNLIQDYEYMTDDLLIFEHGFCQRNCYWKIFNRLATCCFLFEGIDFFQKSLFSNAFLCFQILSEDFQIFRKIFRCFRKTSTFFEVH